MSPVFLLKLGAPQYDPRDWPLFVDSCKRSLKFVLRHNGTSSPQSLLRTPQLSKRNMKQ
ncbi:Uncharacterized protein FKW44_022684 [Caligus rogercresseyi]|uniref:Uncharacterized protein n=1 Tax=Caligus rogercresseyi TaxID=217165 RepID=A0A7T8JUL1_CALRO|nr:Uncharacterized protein FKW44_022684 [Caligus rogercresseyi]